MFPNLIRPAGFASSGGVDSRYSSTIVTTQGRTGLTTIVSVGADDANITIGDIGFDFPLYGALYRSNIFAGSNGFLTFGFGSSAYSGLSRTVPGRALMVIAADHNWSYVGVQAGLGSFRVRWEGQYLRSVQATAVLIWEATFFSSGVIQLALDVLPQNITTTVSSLTKGDDVTFTDYTPNTASSFDSLVFTPVDAGANSHTVQHGSYV